MQITITRKTVLLKKQSEGLRNGKIDMKLFKLNKLNKISDEQKNTIRGGDSVKPKYCVCACCYADEGGSSTVDNGSANQELGLHSGCEGGSVFLPPVE